MITLVFLFRTTHGWYDGGYLLGDGHRGDALIDGTACWQEGAHVSSYCRRLEEAEGTKALHLHLYLSTTDQLTYSNKINYFYTRTPLNNINAPQMIKLHIMYATLQGLLDSISAVMVTGFPTLGGSGLTVRLLTLKILLEPMINFIKGKNLNQAI